MSITKELNVTYRINVGYTQCDIAGENEHFKWICKKEGIGIQFEYTALGTPQINGCVEKEFTILFIWYALCSMVGSFLIP